MKPIQESNFALFFIFFVRFYIESISFLKDKTTVELFFLNAKSCVHKVRLGILWISLLCIPFYCSPHHLDGSADLLRAPSYF